MKFLTNHLLALLCLRAAANSPGEQNVSIELWSKQIVKAISEHLRKATGSSRMLD